MLQNSYNDREGSASEGCLRCGGILLFGRGACFRFRVVDGWLCDAEKFFLKKICVNSQGVSI